MIDVNKTNWTNFRPKMANISPQILNLRAPSEEDTGRKDETFNSDNFAYPIKDTVQLSAHCVLMCLV